MTVLAKSASDSLGGRESWFARVDAWAMAITLVVVFILAAVPRLSARDQFITSDEDQWMSRSGGFAYALTSGELRRTYQNGHPGVTTMWLGVLAIGPERALQYADRISGQRFVASVAGFWDSLAQARVGPALITALTAAVIAALSTRIWGLSVGLLAGALTALDPWAVGLQQLLHTDGLLTGFMAVTALSSINYWWLGAGRAYLVLAGVSAGLALLSKSPALFLGPYVLALAVIAWRCGRINARRLLVSLIAFGALLGVTFVGLWPALWLAPVEMLGRMFAFLRETGGQPDEVGSFFMGQALADPGPLYYPVALAFRLSLGIVLGLVGLAVFARSAPHRGALMLVVLYVLGFSVMMIVSPKKFDRYLLPVEPMLALLAALGAWLLAERIRATRLLVPVFAVILQLGCLLSVYPYYLAYYNPLLGGGPAAARLVMVGNGEGLDQAAHWLNAQASREAPWVAAHSFDILQGMYQGPGEPLRERAPSQADYIVLYGRRIQMRRWGQSLEAYLAMRAPVFTVRINGIDLVEIYPGPHAEATGRVSR